MAVALRTEAVVYYCILRCRGGRRRISVGDSSFHSDHFGFDYGTVDILCPLPVGCQAPSHVAVTSMDGTDVKGADHHPVYLQVLNQEMRSDSFPHNFTVCFSAMFNFTNVLQLVQSVEMLRLLGVTRVVIYKTSCSPHAQRILDYYTHTGLVEVIPWSMARVLKVSAGWRPEDSPGQMHYYGQIPALNDCVYRYMYRTRYVALHDVDELILPQHVDSWPELFPLLELQYGPDVGYMFQNYVFSTAVTVASSSSSSSSHDAPPPPRCCPRWRGVSGVDILSHLRYEPNDQPFTNFKMVVDPRAVFSTSVHGLLDSRRGCVWVDHGLARMYHTRAPVQRHLTADQLVYDGRLLNYSTRLIPAVDAVLKHTGLLPLD